MDQQKHDEKMIFLSFYRQNHQVFFQSQQDVQFNDQRQDKQIIDEQQSANEFLVNQKTQNQSIKTYMQRKWSVEVENQVFHSSFIDQPRIFNGNQPNKIISSYLSADNNQTIFHNNILTGQNNNESKMFVSPKSQKRNTSHFMVKRLPKSQQKFNIISNKCKIEKLISIQAKQQKDVGVNKIQTKNIMKMRTRDSNKNQKELNWQFRNKETQIKQSKFTKTTKVLKPKKQNSLGKASLLKISQQFDINQVFAAQLQSQKSIKIQNIRNDSKNVPKNMVKAFGHFILHKQPSVVNVLLSYAFKYNLDIIQYKLFIKKNIRMARCINIKTIRQLFTIYDFAGHSRRLCYEFLRKYFVSHIFNSKVRHKQLHLSYLNVWRKIIQKPEQFSSVK